MQRTSCASIVTLHVVDEAIAVSGGCRTVVNGDVATIPMHASGNSMRVVLTCANALQMVVERMW